jgi:hypothetical protein
VAEEFLAFELDLLGAVMNQFVPTLGAMERAPPTQAKAQSLPDAQGVYLLIYDGEVLYVDKTDADAGPKIKELLVKCGSSMTLI